MAVMKHMVACAALVLLSMGAAAVMCQDKPEAAAQKAAESWLALVDSGKYSESWDEAASSFKAAVTKQKWEQAAGAVRDQTGKLKSRKLVSANYAKKLPNVPEGEYVVIQYDAAFEKAPAAIETITPMREKDGSWKVAGYFVKPKE
jgi:hypothetical protein